jgi:hypothetical protein
VSCKRSFDYNAVDDSLGMIQIRIYAF